MPDSPFVAILSTWGILSAVCYGIGAWILRAGGVSDRTGNAVVTMVVGWSAWMAAAQISRFFVTATSWGLVIAAAAAVPGYIWTRGSARPTWRHAVIAVAWVGMGAWCAALSLRAVPNYDTGLYHYDMVRWAQAYPLVPGLANLHDRLGFNSSVFVFAAMIDHAPFGLDAHVVLSGFFAWLWAGWVAIESLHTVDQGEDRITRVFAVASLPVFIEWASGNQLPGLGPDIAITCFALIVTGECLRVMASDRFLKERETVLAVMVWVAAAGVAIKLSALGLLGGITVLFAGHAIAAQRRRECSVRDVFRSAGRPAWVFTGLAVVNLGVWAGGNLILSGYPVYPSVVGGLPVGWAVPPQAAEATAAWVRSSARMPGRMFYDYLAGEPWLGTWWRTMSWLWGGQLAAAAVFSAAAACLGRRSRRRIPSSAGTALLPIAASVVYWFGTAPDPRFSGNAATVALAGAAAFLASELSWTRSGVILSVLVAVVTGLPLVQAGRARLVAEWGFWHSAPAPLPTVMFEDKRTESGLQIAVPAKNAQSSWGQRLPATFQFNPKLALRHPPDMRRGFYVTDPTFLPIGWPWPRYAPGTIDDRAYGVLVTGGSGGDQTNRHLWFEPPVRMIVYSVEPRVARLQFEVARIAAPPPAPGLVTVFVGRRKAGTFPLVAGTPVDLRFTLDRGFNEILFVHNWGEGEYRFAAVRTPAGTAFGCANYRFTAAEQPSPR